MFCIHCNCMVRMIKSQAKQWNLRFNIILLIYIFIHLIINYFNIFVFINSSDPQGTEYALGAEPDGGGGGRKWMRQKYGHSVVGTLLRP